jgi:hypothetical protein
VRNETHQGKGYVVRRMFADVDADIYVLADGDATYDAPSVRGMIARLIGEKLDMVVGARVDREEAAYRPGHRVGNRLLSGFVTHIFGQSFSDMLSGYRVFSRRFVKSFPVLSGGFELELPVAEMDTPYYSRPEGSASKLNTWRDGFRILWSIFQIYRAERPLPFFSAIAVGLAAISVGLAIPIFLTFLQQGNVPRFPTAILATGLMLAALLAFASGVVLDTVTRGRREIKLLAYLRYGAPGDPVRD